MSVCYGMLCYDVIYTFNIKMASTEEKQYKIFRDNDNDNDNEIILFRHREKSVKC